jgi:guanylate kinase
VGKGPLRAALRKFYPELAGRFHKLVLYDSRAPRPGEVDGIDYHFRSRDTIEALRGDEDFTVFEVRGDLQALDVRELEGKLADSDVLFEGNPFIGCGLLDFVEQHQVDCTNIFLTPLSKEEVAELATPQRGVSLPDFVTDMMRRKLLRRTTRQKGNLSRGDLENIEIRASGAYSEMQQAWRFTYVIPNHDGEDSEHWDAFYYPIGDARKTLHSFAALLEGEVPAGVETWERGLVP